MSMSHADRPLGLSLPAAELWQRWRDTGRTPRAADLEALRGASRRARDERDAQHRRGDALSRSLAARRRDAGGLRKPGSRRDAGGRDTGPAAAEAALTGLRDWLRGATSELRRVDAAARRRREEQARRERNRPGAEWKAPLSARDRLELTGVAVQGRPRPGASPRVRKAEEIGARLGALFDRNPWRAAEALGADVFLDARAHRGDAVAYLAGDGTVHLDPDEGLVEAWASLAHELGHRELGHDPRGEDLAQREAEADAFMAGFLLGPIR